MKTKGKVSIDHALSLVCILPDSTDYILLSLYIIIVIVLLLIIVEGEKSSGLASLGFLLCTKVS